jgi:hypothetical protein
MENGNAITADGTIRNPLPGPVIMPETLELTNPERPPGLPSLEYNILHYKEKLFFAVSLLVIESSLLPIALFYGLWYGTTLRHGIRTSFPF